MKHKHLVFFSVVFILAVLLPLFMPVTCADPSIIISNYDLYPEVFMPGDSGVLTLTIQNAETQATTTEKYGDATDSITIVENNGAVINKIWINPAYDGNGRKIKSTAGTTGYKNFGNIAPGAGFTITFKMVADENISEGLYFPTVCIDVDDGEDVNFPVFVKISNTSVNLISTNVPSKMSVSGSTEITLSAINNRDAPVEGVTISPREVDGIEFTPDSIFIGTLGPGVSQDVIFSLQPTETGVKNLSFEISYKNGDNVHNDTIGVPIEIIETLDVAPVLYSVPSTIEKGKSTRISLEVFNAKTESITGVIVTPITDATVIPSQYFIGAMDPDDVFSASFDLYADDI
ncbi:MAG: hypothetical protein KAW47_04815, partial [Thermoplasmatales archaeon]|nr:hypothetical protein [Thermoplasmatales archaeon]